MQNLQILLIENSRKAAAHIQTELLKAGILAANILHAVSVQHAIPLLAQERPPVILMDLSASAADGADDLHLLCRTVPESAVILLCDEADSDRIDALCDSCAQDFLMKEALTAQVIFHAIRFALRRQALTIRLQKKAEEVELLKESMESVVQQNMGAVVVIDEQRLIRYANGAAADLFGRLPEELRGSRLPFGIAAGQTVDAELEIPTGSKRSVELRGVEILWENQPATLVTIRNNIAELAADTMYIDSLTGINNKAYLEEQACFLDCSKNLPLCVIIGDVNNLQLINDSLGYAAGDGMLKMVADCFRGACLRESVVIRCGGDEFMLIQSCCDEHDAEHIMKKITQSCKESSMEGFPISIALGSAVKYSGDTLSLNDLMEIAGEHMFARKYTVASPSKCNAAISALEKSLYAKDYATAMHTSRVRDLCVGFGRYLQMEPVVIDELIVLSALHDIGKIALPSSLLCKPGPLSDDEWETIKTHPTVGAKIARTTQGMDMIAHSIQSHHERWDGTGYPNGQKGEEIPLAARILSIVDSFDVMTHDRPYRHAISQPEALEEIMHCSGAQFDPQLATAFITFIRIGKPQS